MRRIIGVLAVLLLLTSCGDPGEAAARAELTAREKAVTDTLDHNWRLGINPVWLVRSAVITPAREETGHDGGPYTVSVEPLGWDDQHLDLRFSVDTTGYSDGNVFGASYGAGSAGGCVRFTLGFDIGRTELDCAGTTAVVVPPAPEVAALDPAALLAALRTDGYDQAVAAARTAYESDGLVLDAAVVEGSWAIVVTGPTRTTASPGCALLTARCGRP